MITFENVFKSGLTSYKEEEKKYLDNFFGDKPFAFIYEAKDTHFFFCSCGHHVKKHYSSIYESKLDFSKCPDCGTDNIYDMYDYIDDDCDFKNDISIKTTENGIHMTIEQYSSTFDMCDIVIWLKNDFIIDFDFANNKIDVKGKTIDRYDNLGDMSYIHDDDKLDSFLNENYPEIHEICNKFYFDFKDTVLYLYMCSVLPALRKLDIATDYTMMKIVKDVIGYSGNFNSPRYVIEYFENFNMNGESINEVFGIPKSLSDVFGDGVCAKDVSNLSDFIDKTSGYENFIQRLSNGNFIDSASVCRFMDKYNQLENVDFIVFFKFIFDFCVREDCSLCDVLYDLNMIRDKSRIDYTKKLTKNYIKSLKLREYLNDNDILSEFTFDEIAKKPTLENFINVASN